MDRGFKNNADFKMNLQSFKLSDFGIEMEPCHGLDRCKNAAKYQHRIVGVQSQQMQMRAGRLSGSIPGNNGSSGVQAGCNLSQLPSSCATLTCNSQPRRSPNQLQSADRFRASSPNNLAGSVLQPNVSSVPSPGYWNQYGGQESGVNVVSRSAGPFR
ncbi:hypothetical protein K0M31_019343 [Melipona bicolor]|uniref:Uncharacterized protein n=1 Tax=Melipona bicolor TaxID=60889 RepID=A0AA40KR36_9HYME|nr:hypothetical protein K0M31_019343 [Melipona bicolor]